jgi:DGQHR domain-containing protein
MNYACKAKYDDPKRKLVDEKTGKDLLELDGVYYEVSSQTLIYLEATTKADELTQEVVRKHGKLMTYCQELDKQLGVSGKVVNRRLLFVSEKVPAGKDLESLDQAIKVINLSKNELDLYYKYLSSKIGGYLRYEFNAQLKIVEKEDPILVPAIKLNMSGTTVYLLQLSVEKILKTCYVVRKKDLLGGGYQRIINDKKLKSIGEFLNTERASIFPNSILVNLNDKVKEAEKIGDNLVKLEFPIESGAYHIIDGQHRVYGYCKSNITDLNQPKLIVVGFKNITPEDEARYFIKINISQTSIDPTLLSLLMAKTDFAENEKEYWDSRPFKLVLELDKIGLFKDKIYKGIYLDHKKRDKPTLSYVADRVSKVKMLSYRKKEAKGMITKDGLLQKADSKKTLADIATEINNYVEIIINASGKDPKIIEFFTTNRGFDVFCRLLKGYFRLIASDKKLTLDMNDYFAKMSFDKEFISSLSSYYGSGGMSLISSKVEGYLRKKDKTLKKLDLAR